MGAKTAKRPPRKPPKRYSSDPTERAKELVAEGRFGGKREGAGRPRKVSPESQSPRPASAHVAAGVAELGPQMLGVIRDVLTDDQASDGAKLRALKAAVGIELKETELQLEEAKRTGSRPPDFDTPEEGATQLMDKLRANPILRDRLLAVLTAADGSAGVASDSG